MNGYKYCPAIVVILMTLLTVLPAFAQSEGARRKQDAPGTDEDESVPADRITIHQLKRKMDANEEVVIIDTRKGSSYVGSTVKIKGAIHIIVDDLEAKMKDLPKNKLIVTYCA
ncbi:MAG: rhodanese-like domain-containing protein [Blastocatellia bacterium]